MECDTFNGDFMVKSIWILSLNLIYHLFHESPGQSLD